MTEEALQAAVLSLEASTAAFNRQAAILRTQTKFLNSSKDEAFERIHRSRTKQLESQNLNLVVGLTLGLLFLPYEFLSGRR